MKNIGELIKSDDWKNEKHVPVIHAPEKVKAGERFELKVSVGDAIKHPNTKEHYIAWIKVFFIADDGKFLVELATFNFNAHGEDENYTEPVGITEVAIQKSGTIYAMSYCNLHGLWESNARIAVE